MSACRRFVTVSGHVNSQAEEEVVEENKENMVNGSFVLTYEG